MADLIDRASLGVGRCNPDVMLDPAYAAGWNGLLNIINNATSIDPVHAAGACYCRECGHLLQDLSVRTYHTCMRFRLPQRVNLDDFCSWGQRREED